MNYLIGVDGGGSKTVALLAKQDGTIIGRGVSGSSNVHTAGLNQACVSLDLALRLAFSNANVTPVPSLVKKACFGLAGVERPGDQSPFLAWADSNWPGMPVEFVSDARLVLAAGTPAGWGLGVICGTGSIAYGRDPSGRTARAGGWGYLLGDEGSGYDIGLSALRAVMRAGDGRGRQTLLTRLIFDHWSLAAVQDLVSLIYRPDRSNADIAGLAVLVEEAAAHGDPLAQDILHHAGNELALAASVVVHKLQLPAPIPCALVGGILTRGELVSQEFLAAAAGRGIQLSPVQKVTEPAVGAIRLAGRLIS